MVRILDATPVPGRRAELGECPVWEPAGRLLWWIDWVEGVVYRSDLVAGTDAAHHVGRSLAAVAPSPSGRVAMALGHAFAELDPETGLVHELAAVPLGTETRFCDGKCDAGGRFWAGTMALDEASPLGALFVMECDGRVRRVLDDVVVSNGLCWSPDNTKFYYCDTATQRVDVFDFDLPRGTITSRRALVEFRVEEGAPDGLTIDRDGFLWVALWDGWQVRRYSPAGELDTVVRLPVARPTCCALGGEELCDLFITTALPDAADERQGQPLAGGLFRVSVDVPGLPASCCGYRPDRAAG